MSGEVEAWVCETLIEAERRRCVSRVIRVDSDDAVAKGDNFATDLRRVKLSVVLHSGELQERSLIYKGMPTTKYRMETTKRFGVFEIEAKVFKDVLSKMGIILRQKEVNSEILWPKFYGVKGNDGLLFEDLCVKGFTMADRRKGMDFGHASVAVRSLARFHALAAVLKERGDHTVKDFDISPFVSDPDITDSYYKNSFADLANVLETKWKGEWSQYGEGIRKLGGMMAGKLVEKFKKDDKKFNTLNHGDCWLNNMMFRYGNDKKPVAVRFIDFQLCHFNHPGFDLQFFCQTSLNLETRSRKAELLQEYHSSLDGDLRLFEYPGHVPTFQDVKTYYEEAGYYGVGMGLGSLPILLMPPDRAPDMEKFAERMTKNENMRLAFYDYEGDIFVKTIKHVIKEAAENGYI